MPLSTRVLLVPLLFAASMAQAIRVEGIVRKATTRMPVRGAVVRMERAGLVAEQCTTRIDGHYRFELKAGQQAEISYASADHLTRRLVFDASAVPREWTDALVASMDVRLFPPMAGVDPALQVAPIGIASWSEAEENMVWDVESSDSLIGRWNALLERHLLAHPEQRPDDATLRVATLVDLMLRYPLAVAALLGLLVWAMLRRLRRRTSGATRAWGLGAILLLCAWGVFELRNAGGPLRFLALLGVLIGISVAFNLVVALMERRRHAAFGPIVPMDASAPADEHDKGPEEDEVDEEAEADRAAHPPAADGALRRSASRWWERNRDGVLLFASMALLVAEWRFGLENTLQVGPLVALGLGAGVVFAGAIATIRQRHAIEPVGLLAAGGVFWTTLPLVTLTALSCVNRLAADDKARCGVWPVVKVHEGSKGRISVHVAIMGEDERLEMDRAIKVQLTSLDSLRCCVRRGALGFGIVDGIEPVITAEDPH